MPDVLDVTPSFGNDRKRRESQKRVAPELLVENPFSHFHAGGRVADRTRESIGRQQQNGKTRTSVERRARILLKRDVRTQGLNVNGGLVNSAGELGDQFLHHFAVKQLSFGRAAQPVCRCRNRSSQFESGFKCAQPSLLSRSSRYSSASVAQRKEL